MIYRLFATTALVTGLVSGALADDAVMKTAPKSATTSRLPAVEPSVAPQQILASSVIGKTVYTGVDEQGEAIGEVSDVVLNANGGAEALIIGVGGFLGIGEKDVAINFDRVSWSQKDGRSIIVVSATKADLQAAPAFQKAPVMDSVATTQDQATDTMEAPAAKPVITDEGTQADQQTMGAAPDTADPEAGPDADAAAGDDQDLAQVDPALISADKLIGTAVKVADGTKLGEIGAVLKNKDQKVEAYVIDVGGFLGIGEKPVAISADSVQIMADDSGTLTIFSPFTKAQLESQPAYTAEAYKANPNGIRLSNPSN